MELTHGLWRELIRRGEFLPSGWVEEAAQDLARGTLRGWVVSSPEGIGAVGFYSLRGPRAYGHVHVHAASADPGSAPRLMEVMRRSLPPPVARIDVGVTGLSPAAEIDLGATLRRDTEADVLVRWAMSRQLGETDLAPPALPNGIEAVPVLSVPLDELTELDVRAFRGSPDESLVAESVEEDQRVLSEILGGLLGRFLGEASRGLRTLNGELVGALLTGEQTSRTAVYLDLIVDPAHRRRGLGTYLARWGFRALLALGYESVRLWVTESNAPARQLYESLGFQKVEQAMIFRWDRRSSGAASASR